MGEGLGRTPGHRADRVNLRPGRACPFLPDAAVCRKMPSPPPPEAMMGPSESPDACPPREDRLTRRHWVLLLVLACVQFCHVLDFIIMVPLGPTLEKSLHVNTRQFGLLVSAYGFAACAA